MTDSFDALADLPSPPENYTDLDRYRDFRVVFMQTDEGRRVLRRIMEMGCIFAEPRLISPIDPYMLAAFRGKRQLALEIFKTMNDEPQAEKPATQARAKAPKR